MKIGLVCPYDFLRHGAVQKLVLLLDSELTSRGHDVRIITPRPRGYKGDPPERTIFAGHSTKWNTPIATTLEVGASLKPNGLEKMLEAENFDIINVHEPEVPVLGAQIAARASCPIVATFHATHPNNRAAKTIELFRVPYAVSIFKRLAAMTAVSDSAAKFVRDWSGQQIKIVPNYVDLGMFRHDKKTKREPDTILYLGRLEKRKGVKHLLRAFAELAERNEKVKLVIAGDGADREKLEDWVYEHEVPRVRFLGAVSEDEKVELLRKASVFCSPAIYGESFGIVLLEAMASGVPVVAGDNPGYASVLKEHGRIGLVNPRDVDDFARRLEIFLYDETLRNGWLEWASGYVEQFDSKRIIDQYEEVYKKVLIQADRNVR